MWKTRRLVRGVVAREVSQTMGLARQEGVTTNWDVIVVGGGLAGLAAGATAARVGAKALVLEAHQPGGRARTVDKDGFVFNMGGHALYAGCPGMAVLRELGVQLAGARPPLKEYRMLIDGELHLMPSGPSTMLKTTAMGARGKASFAKLLGLLPRMKPEQHAGMTVDEWLAAQDVRPDAERVIRALIRTSTYTDDFANLSAEAAISQVQAAASDGVLYLDGGWGPLLDGLRSKVEVREGAAVRAVEPDETGVVVETADGDRLIARTAIVAPGTPAATRSLLPDAPDWGDLGDPLYAACLDVGARGVPSPGYVVSTDDPVFATRQAPPARQAPPGDSVVALLRYRTRSAAEDRAELDRYRRLAGVADEHVVVERFLARMVVVGAIPLARNGGLRGRPPVDATGSSRVFMAGDWVGHEGMLADTSLASGRAAGLAAVRAAEASATMVS